jgi:hypothetical protein
MHSFRVVTVWVIAVLAICGHAGAFPGHRNIVWSTSNGRRVAAVMINTNQGHVVLSKLRAVAETALCSG